MSGDTINAVRALLIGLSVVLVTMLAGAGPAEAVSGDYKDILIPAGSYVYYPLVDQLGTDNEVDIEIKLNSGPECRIWIIRPADGVSLSDSDVKVNKTLTGAGDKTEFKFDIPDDSRYSLYVFNDHDTESIRVDVQYDDYDEEAVGMALLICAIIIIVAIVIFIVIIVVIIKLGSRKKEGPPPPPGGYPPPQQGGYPPPRQ